MKAGGRPALLRMMSSLLCPGSETLQSSCCSQTLGKVLRLASACFRTLQMYKAGVMSLLFSQTLVLCHDDLEDGSNMMLGIHQSSAGVQMHQVMGLSTSHITSNRNHQSSTVYSPFDNGAETFMCNVNSSIVLHLEEHAHQQRADL